MVLLSSSESSTETTDDNGGGNDDKSHYVVNPSGGGKTPPSRGASTKVDPSKTTSGGGHKPGGKTTSGGGHKPGGKTTSRHAPTHGGKTIRPGPIVTKPGTPEPGHHTSVAPRGPTHKPTTTTPPPIIATKMPLVCTVSSVGSAQILLPQLHVCSYVFFTHVMSRNKSLYASDGSGAFQEFVRAIEASGGYSGGISFDMRYGINEKTGAALLPTALEEARTELLELYNKSNIKHYGILNCITMPGLMSYLVAVLPSTFSKMRSLQRGDPNSVIVLAFGAFQVNVSSDWTMYYRRYFQELGNYDVDILIAVTSEEGQIGDKVCYAAPTSVWNTTNTNFSSIERHSKLLLDSQHYPRSSLYVGLSFEMGVNLYQLSHNDTAIEDAPFAPCDQYTQVAYEQVCDPHVRLKTLNNVVESGVISNYVFFYDSWDTIKKKVDAVLSLKLPPKIAWLLYNTHFSMTPGTCISSFDRERKLRDYLASK
ncbi:uncharacterized protein LOC142764895 [Rhipicephalus microplus]|uniref:uncharacterized protein LOC142764895 n=1 Tax=Rhipicephalus microplus TaxID=6941 RepID=UPI003F6CEF2A